MTTAVAQINIPFELLAEAVTTLNTEHKVKLWKLLGQEVAESQRITMMLIIDANILQQIAICCNCRITPSARTGTIA